MEWLFFWIIAGNIWFNELPYIYKLTLSSLFFFLYIQLFDLEDEEDKEDKDKEDKDKEDKDDEDDNNDLIFFE